MNALQPTGALMAALLEWFRVRGRTLPWRTERSPYRVVVSEFMLQQTQVDRVIPAFERFVAAFPSFRTLAAATPGEVVRAWQGLGYNMRALRLHALAQAVCERHDGNLPHDRDALRALPGVGPYTLSAIRAFAYDCDDVAFDTNVARVLRRALLGVADAPGKVTADLAAAAAGLVPPGFGNAVNSALMDLGATICTARAPKCLLCPLLAVCKAAPITPASAATARSTMSEKRKPPKFEETSRYLRGRIVDALRALPARSAISLLDLCAGLATLAPSRSSDDVRAAVDALAHDGLVQFDGERLSLDAAPTR